MILPHHSGAPPPEADIERVSEKLAIGGTVSGCSSFTGLNWNERERRSPCHHRYRSDRSSTALFAFKDPGRISLLLCVSCICTWTPWMRSPRKRLKMADLKLQSASSSSYASSSSSSSSSQPPPAPTHPSTPHFFLTHSELRNPGK